MSSEKSHRWAHLFSHQLSDFEGYVVTDADFRTLKKQFEDESGVSFVVGHSSKPHDVSCIPIFYFII